MKEGVRISGYDGFKQIGRTNKKKKQGEDNFPDSNTEVREIEDEGLENAVNNTTSGQRHTKNKEKQSEEGGEEADNEWENKEKKGDSSSSLNKQPTTNGICKPIKTDNLRVVITDPEIQAYR